MSFLCPNCQISNPIAQGQTHCAHCRHPFRTQTAPATIYPAESGKPKESKSGSSWWIYILVGAASFFLLFIVTLFVSFFWWVGKSAVAEFGTPSPDIGSLEEFEGKIPAQAKAAFTRRPKSTPSISPGQVAESYAEFKIPDIKSTRSLDWANVHQATFGSHLSGYSSDRPSGWRTSVRVYLPVNLSADAKIPCVLVAPAGSNLLTGKDCDDFTYTDEIKPYVTAGMAVCHYSLDGSQDKMNASSKERALPSSFRTFTKAHGGVINGQRALDFVLKRCDQIDPARIYCAGHSSAGTLSLQLASTDSRISKCVAYAPAPSLKKRFAELLSDPNADVLLPGLRPYIQQWSPDSRIQKFGCPVFIYHALDDTNTPYANTKTFHDQLIAAGKPAKLVTGKRGGHYQSMIDQGIPAAINWLKNE